MKPTKTNVSGDSAEIREDNQGAASARREASVSVNVSDGYHPETCDRFDVKINRAPAADGKGAIPSPECDCIQRRRVILLDDDAVTCRLNALVLARAGYVLDTAGDGEQGWNALCSRNYDLLVTDVDMPGLDGLQLIARARKAGFTLPIIVASGSPELGNPEEYPSLGIAAILHKPYSIAELVTSARSAVPVARHIGGGTINRLEPDKDTFPLACPLMRAAVDGDTRTQV